jgi:hypothetical protein
LKFLFNLSLNGLITGPNPEVTRITLDQLSALLIIYGMGFAGVYLALLILYLHAYRLRDALDLSALERFDTRFGIYRMISLVSVGLLAAGVAWLRWFGGWGGLIYLALFPILRFIRILQRRKRTPLLAAADTR